jgi:hypothetical protein
MPPRRPTDKELEKFMGKVDFTENLDLTTEEGITQFRRKWGSRLDQIVDCHFLATKQFHSPFPPRII